MSSITSTHHSHILGILEKKQKWNQSHDRTQTRLSQSIRPSFHQHSNKTMANSDLLLVWTFFSRSNQMLKFGLVLVLLLFLLFRLLLLLVCWPACTTSRFPFCRHLKITHNYFFHGYFSVYLLFCTQFRIISMMIAAMQTSFCAVPRDQPRLSLQAFLWL